MLCVYVLRICQTPYIREPVSVADTGKQTHGLSRHDTDFLTIDTNKIQSLYVTIQKAFLSHIKKSNQHQCLRYSHHKHLHKYLDFCYCFCRCYFAADYAHNLNLHEYYSHNPVLSNNPSIHI